MGERCTVEILLSRLIADVSVQLTDLSGSLIF